MQPTNRKHEPGVIPLLLTEPHRFQFGQLLSLLVRHLRRQGLTYERAFREVLRFRNSLSLSFPPSEVQAVEVEPQDPDQTGPVHTGVVKHIRITPAFIGLLGAAGTLPLHHTERIAGRKAIDGDASQHALMDVFSNRLIGLFYEAWAKYRVEHGIDTRGDDRLLPMLGAMAGGTEACNDVKQRAAAYYAALLRTRPVCAATVEAVLADYFNVPIQVEQLVGRWDSIPENKRSTLGCTAPVLGKGAVLGVRLWRHDLRARLHIGPLDESQFAQFLPGGSALRELAEMVRLFAVPMLRYEVRLLLAAPCIKRMSLHTRAAPRKLGWDTFLTSTPGRTKRPEINTELRLS